MIINLGIGSILPQALAAYTKATVSPSVPMHHRPTRLVTHASEVLSGDVFCALKGNRDGHAFIAEALARGAAFVLCEKAPSENTPALIVENTLLALGEWANGCLKEQPPTVIAVTGSVGKTTLKNTLSCFLSAHAPTHATEGNQNNALGVPYTVLSAPKDTRFLIAECGSNHPGEISYLSRILCPDVAVVTCIGHAHIGAFGSREGIAKEKLSIADGLKPNGALFLPFGEALTASLAPKSYSRTFVKLPSEKERLAWELDERDIPALWAIAYTKAISRHLGIPFEKAPASLLRAASSRRTLLREKGVLWIDDSYNASPESVYAALVSLGMHAGRKLILLGDMLELGDSAPAMHRAMGKLAAMSADHCFFFGAHAEDYAAGAIEAGARQAHAKRQYTLLHGDAREMAKSVVPHLKMGDTVLAKASHALHADVLLHQIQEMYIS